MNPHMNENEIFPKYLMKITSNICILYKGWYCLTKPKFVTLGDIFTKIQAIHFA